MEGRRKEGREGGRKSRGYPRGCDGVVFLIAWERTAVSIFGAHGLLAPIADSK